MADYFVSFTSSDRTEAHWIGRELRNLGHVPHVHDWEIKGGDDIYAWMQARHEAADHVLCVVSDDYLKAPYSTLERNAALWQAANARPGFVLFVVVKPCKLPTLSDHLNRCELFGVSEVEMRARLAAYISDPAPPVGGLVAPTQVFAASNIPIRVPEHFLGRDDALAAVEAALKRYEGRVAITALHGLRGVGKTTLAAAYADLHRRKYRATWWIRAQTEATMRADLVALGVRLRWVAADEREEPALSAVRERLRHEGAGLLLIYDNAIDAENLRVYLPPAGAAQVLVTSNARVWRGIAEPVEIRLWPKEIGAEYLIVRTRRDKERAEAEALSLALGGLPLAHEQAAAYCDRLEVSLAQYRKRFDDAPARLLDDARHAPVEYHDGLTVAKTFGLAIEQAAKLHPAAEPLIVHAALLAPEPIPLFLFTEGREKFGEPLATLLVGDGLEEALAALRAFALVDRETIVDERDPAIATETMRLHRLVREIVRSNHAGDHAPLERSWADVMFEAYPRAVFHDPGTWPRARLLDPLSISLLDAESWKRDDVATQTSFILNSLALYRQRALGSYGQAEALFKRARKVCETALGAASLETATTLTSYGWLLTKRGKHARAKAMLKRALSIRERKLGREHPDTALTLKNFGWACNLLGDEENARLALERSLTILEKTLGREHPFTSMSIDNLADFLRDRGDLDRSLKLFERALAIDEKTLGPEHPNTAVSLFKLGSLHQAKGRAVSARKMLDRALAINEKTLGPKHPETNRVRRQIATLMLQHGDAEEGLAMSKAALLAHDEVLGHSHNWTQDSARAVAEALEALGRAEEAAAVRREHSI